MSAAGIVQTFRKLETDRTRAPQRSLADSIMRIGVAAADGDATALGTLDQSGRELGQALGSLANTLDPEAVIVAGWVPERLGIPFLNRVAEAAREQCLPPVSRETEFSMRPTRGSSVALGLVALSFEAQLQSQLRHAGP